MNLSSLFMMESTPLRKLLLMKMVAGGAPLTEYTATGNPATFETNVAKPLRSLVVPFSPVQDLHGYDNPWPAGGGKNLFNKDNFIALDNVWFNTTTKALTSGGGNRGLIVPCKSDTSYTLSFQVKNSTDIQLVSFDDVPVVGSTSENYRIIGTSDTSKAITITTGAFDSYLFVKYNNLNVTQANTNDQLLAGIQIEEGTTASSWTPFSNICPITGWTGMTVSHSGADTTNPTTYPVSWQKEAGTVYGGSLDLTTGVLTVTHGVIASYNGETLPGEWISDRDVYAAGTTPTTGAQVVYELATPTATQLTAQQISTLVGQNNIWTDTNGTNTVKYLKLG